MMECRNQQLVLEQIGNDHYFYNEAIKTLRTNIHPGCDVYQFPAG